MIIARQVQENFSRASVEYDAQATLQQELLARVLETAQQIFPAGARLLDIGCGTGLFSGKAPQWNTINLDIAAGMCAYAKQRSIAVQADARALPVQSSSLDGVVSSLCLQWVEYKATAFAEIARVLKPGGHAVLMTLGEQTLKELRGTQLQLLPMAPLKEYQQLVQDSGLELLRCESEELHKSYASLSALLHSMRSIGAGHAFMKQQALGAQKFRRLSDAFARHAHNQATWQPVLLVCRKRSAA